MSAKTVWVFMRDGWQEFPGYKENPWILKPGTFSVGTNTGILFLWTLDGRKIEASTYYTEERGT